MSDIIDNDLVRNLAGDQSVVYMPARVRPASCNASTESYTDRPDVQAVAQAYFESPDRLHGDRVPETTILKERPIHRAMIWLTAQGASAEDIAKQTGYGVHSIRQILRQPWARLSLVQILKETGQDNVKHFLKNEVAPSLEVLREIRDDTLARKSDRISSAREILDRALGKPTVHVESENTNRNVPADIQRLDAEISAVQKQLQARASDLPPQSN